MDIEFDPAKDAINFAQHGLSFEDFSGFDAAPTVITDDRYDYGEVRYQAFGPIDGKLYCLVFTMRGSAVRAISFRRANGREKARYGKGSTS